MWADAPGRISAFLPADKSAEPKPAQRGEDAATCGEPRADARAGDPAYPLVIESMPGVAQAGVRLETAQQRTNPPSPLSPPVVTTTEGEGFRPGSRWRRRLEAKAVKGSIRYRQNARAGARANGGRCAISGLTGDHAAGNRVRSRGEAGAGTGRGREA